MKAGRVVHCKKEPYDIYIGRPGFWGNPFTVKEYGRERSILLYKEFLREQINEDPYKWIPALAELQGKTLGCWCDPEPCHGDILVVASEWAQDIMNKRRRDEGTFL